MADNKFDQQMNKDQQLDAGRNVGGNIDSGDVTGFDNGAQKDLGADIGSDVRTTGFEQGGMRNDVADETGSISRGSDIDNIGSGLSKDLGSQNVTNDDMGSFGGEKKEGFMDKLGDAVEGIGHKISEAGAPGLGQKVHDLGDKLEQKHDNKNHPHDV